MFRVRREMTFRDVMAAINRHRRPAIIIMLVTMALGAVLYKMTPPTYRSSEELLLTPSLSTPTSSGQDIVATLTSPATSIDVPTQIQVLQSSKLMGEIYASSGIGAFDDNAPDIPVVRVDLLKETYALQVIVEAPTAELAELVAKNLPRVYQDFLHTTRQGQVDKELAYLADQRAGQYNDNLAAIDAYNKFEVDRTLKPQDREAMMRTDRVQTYQASADKVDADIAGAQERLATLQAVRKLMPATIVEPHVSTSQSEIELEKQKISELQGQRQALLQTYQPSSRKVQEIDAEIAEQQQRLAAIPPNDDKSAKVQNPKIIPMDQEIAGAKASLQAAFAEQVKVQGQLGQAKQELEEYTKLEPTEEKLAADVDRTRVKLQETDHMISELKLRQSSIVEPVTPLSDASKAIKVKPVPVQYLGVAALLGLFLGIGFALGRDALRDTVATFSDVEDLCLGERVVYLPSLPAMKSNGGNALVPADAPALDTYRILRFALFEPELQDATGSVLVTSAGRRDGKTMLACNLAEVLAASGKKVVLVDANHRHPSLAPIYEVADAPGLGDMLSGSVPLAAALEPTAVENLLVVAAGLWPAGGGGLLDSGRMQSVHEQLKAVADVVIFDAPNCLESADVMALATICDSVVFAAEIGTTRRPQMTRGLELIRRSRAKFLGVVLRDHTDRRVREKVTV